MANSYERLTLKLRQKTLRAIKARPGYARPEDFILAAINGYLSGGDPRDGKSHRLVALAYFASGGDETLTRAWAELQSNEREHLSKIARSHGVARGRLVRLRDKVKRLGEAWRRVSGQEWEWTVKA
jgi:hypothetical protein